MLKKKLKKLDLLGLWKNPLTIRSLTATDQSHARHPDRIGGIEWNRQTDSLSRSLRDIAFEISRAGEKTRRDYTRDLLASHASCGPPNLQILCYFAS